VALDQCVDQRHEPAGDEHGAGDVEALGVLVLGLRYDEDGARDGERGYREVDEEDPAPGDVLRQDAAEDQAQGRAAGGDGGVDAEGAVALLALGEDHRDERQGGGGHQCAAGALHGAGREQDAEVAGETADQRGGCEKRRAGQEDPAPADAIGEFAAQQ